MIVISDTSTIRYLVVLGQVNLLQQLFQTIIITHVVYQELTGIDTPHAVKAWMRNLPLWVDIHTCDETQSDSALCELDPGEKSTIHLAGILNADLVLLDELAGRRIAKARGLRITGLLGVLDQAASRNLIEIGPVIEQLIETNFYVSPRLLQQLQQKHQNS